MKAYYRAILILGICGSLCGCGGPAGYQRKETDTASIKSRFEIPEMIETELADNKGTGDNTPKCKIWHSHLCHRKTNGFFRYGGETAYHFFCRKSGCGV